ncbi:HEXXH motif-containing putative peptide modification protein [Streptomyces sp. DG2A-72]|uniref:aKG-HExxH-type peptide beta-hydroxylase n=1 Tax=Streptomyces sp. DG2A-72 TaxID=3051386 RepID=UPI00265B9A90|nr:HEXXH motif-containing putative peptide modification protein [Streptomyces sp. DG2A-72]MDO0936259.1 HEXXH motif-containing putative peptide modification protein [Streptomyces sp. DG2A-72]
MTRAPVSSEVFTALARTRPAPKATTVLRVALHARRMLLLKSLLVRVERQSAALAPAVRRRFERDWSLLVRAERTDAAAVREVVDYPMTGAWLTEALAAPDGAAFARQLAQVGGVAVAAAVRAGCPVDGTLPTPSGALVLPGLGVLRCPSGHARLSGQPGLVRITDDAGHNDVLLPRPVVRPGGGTHGGTGRGPGWSALRTLPGSTVVLDDLDPYRAPPSGIGPQSLLAAERPYSSYRMWARRWREASALLSATDPDRAAELRGLLRAVVPLAAAERPGGTSMGATLRSAPGAALTQLPDEGRELAESLVHETHHSKLAALDELVPLCRPGRGTAHRVAWRSDPRPVPAVLQGAYAHLALTDLWWRAGNGSRAPADWRLRARERFEAQREEVGEALSVLLESDELTCAGREFVQEMGRHHAGLGVTARNLL